MDDGRQTMGRGGAFIVYRPSSVVYRPWRLTA